MTCILSGFILPCPQRLAGNRSKGSAFAKQHCASFVAVDGMLVVGTICFTKCKLIEVFTSNLCFKTALNVALWSWASLQGECLNRENN